MMKDDKWLMFKNYMHNELEISKDDIRDWIKEAVSEQATLMIDNTFTNFSLKDIINRLVKQHIEASYGRDFDKEIKKMAAEELAKSFKLILKEK